VFTYWVFTYRVFTGLSPARGRARQVGGTRGNAASSRSHCVFTAVVESRVVEDGITSVRTSRLHLVDLAGALWQPSMVYTV